MTERQGRYTDKLHYRAIIGAVTVLIPVVVNIVTLAYLWGRMTERVDDLEKTVGTLQTMVVAHITATGAMMRVVPQSDKSTTPEAPRDVPKIRPQRFSGGECHIPALTPKRTREAHKWPVSPRPS